MGNAAGGMGLGQIAGGGQGQQPNPLANALAAQPQSATPQPAIDIGLPKQQPASDKTNAYRQAIANLESGGDYSALGKETHGGRAIGKYQIMSYNVGPWTKDVLGKSMTPDQFLADHKAQDAVFDAKFGNYVNKFGERGAAQAWLGGPGSVGQIGRKDALGTSVGAYGDRFIAGLGGKGNGSAVGRVLSASLDTGAGAPATGADNADTSQAATTPLQRVLAAAAPPGQQPQETQPMEPQQAPVIEKGKQAIAAVQQSLGQNLQAGANTTAQQRKQALEQRIKYQNV